MFIPSGTALVLSAAMLGQPARPVVAMPGANNQEILGNCLSYFRSTRASDRSFALATMGLMGRDAKSASRQIVMGFLDNAPEVRQAANLALPQVNKPLYQPIKDVLNAGDTPDAYAARLTGIQNLARLGPEGEPSVPVVLQFMQKARAGDRPMVVDTLAAIAFRDPGITDLFGNWLRAYPDAAVRLEVLKVLPKMRDAAGQVKNIIGALEKETVPEVRIQAIQTLGKIGKGNDEAIQALNVLAQSDNQATSDAAKLALAELQK